MFLFCSRVFISRSFENRSILAHHMHSVKQTNCFSRCCGRVQSPNDVIQKIEMTLNNIHTTTQYQTNNGFRNIEKPPTNLSEKIQTWKPLLPTFRWYSSYFLFARIANLRVYICWKWYSLKPVLNSGNVVIKTCHGGWKKWVHSSSINGAKFSNSAGDASCRLSSFSVSWFSL